MDKVVYVFLDWQNVYMRARECFHGDAHSPEHAAGQVDPVDLALVLMRKHAERNPEHRYTLGQVRIYRGMPLQQHDEKGYAAARRQHAAWSRDARVQVYARDLRYPRDYGQVGCSDKPREKGVDVALAVDVVTTGLDGLYDVGIVMSADSDLVPALEYLDKRLTTRGKPVTEVAAWRPSEGYASRISFKRNRPFCTWLTQQDYWGIADDRDYTIPSAKRAPSSHVPKPGDWFKR